MVEPQGPVQAGAGTDAKGEGPTLCHPGCVHQPVTPWRPLLTLYLLAPPPHVAYATDLCGAEGKDCTSCPGSRGLLDTMSNLGRCWPWCWEWGYLRKNGHRPD